MASSSGLPASVAAAPITGQGREFLLLKTATDGLKTAGADLGVAVCGLTSLVQGNPLTTVPAAALTLAGCVGAACSSAVVSGTTD